MKIVEVNCVPYGSTGMIARSITTLSKKYGESFFAYSWTKKKRRNVLEDEFLIGGLLEKYISIKLEFLTGNIGSFGFFSTKKLINKIKKIKPNIVHLHNLHEGYINLKMLFNFLDKENINVVWTLHDCWSFTGHCPHFDMIKCNKWKKKCYNCSIYKNYPKSLFDNSKKMYERKKKIFTGLKEDNLTIVTPSIWLSNMVKKSFLSKYNTVVINNGINLDVFKPSTSNDYFKNKYGIVNKKVLLGVSYNWTNNKGLDIFVKLANDLDSKYQIVLVGTSKKIDKILPPNVISIHRTSSQEELIKIYSSADMFINPTREEVFGLVNVEALACGLPVITFNTGGSPEIIDDSCGYVIEKDNYDELKKYITDYFKNERFKKYNCIKRARSFDGNEKYHEYIDLFKKICTKGNYKDGESDEKSNNNNIIW